MGLSVGKVLRIVTLQQLQKKLQESPGMSASEIANAARDIGVRPKDRNLLRGFESLQDLDFTLQDRINHLKHKVDKPDPSTYEKVKTIFRSGSSLLSTAVENGAQVPFDLHHNPNERELYSWFLEIHSLRVTHRLYGESDLDVAKKIHNKAKAEAMGKYAESLKQKWGLPSGREGDRALYYSLRFSFGKNLPPNNWPEPTHTIPGQARKDTSPYNYFEHFSRQELDSLRVPLYEKVVRTRIRFDLPDTLPDEAAVYFPGELGHDEKVLFEELKKFGYWQPHEGSK